MANLHDIYIKKAQSDFKNQQIKNNISPSYILQRHSTSELLIDPLLKKYEENLYSNNLSRSKDASKKLLQLGFPAISVLTTALKNERDHVKINAANAIKWIGANARVAIFNLIQMLNDNNKTCRETAAMTLGILKSIPLVSIFALINALNDRETTVRQYASAALGEFNGSDLNYVLNDLQYALDDEDKHVRTFIQYAITKTHV